MAGLKTVAKHAGVKPNVLKQVFATIVNMLGEGDSVTVKIQGFGSFTVYTIPGRTVASPVINNGEPTVVAEQLGIKFHASDIAKGRVNFLARRKAQQPARLDRIMKDPPKRAAKGPIPAKPAKPAAGRKS